MKRIMNIIIWCFLLAVTVVLLAFVNLKNQKTSCKDIEININYQSEACLIDENDIMEMVKSFEGDIKGRKISSLKISEIENILSSNPYVYRADVYSTINGVVKMNIIQRKPLVRIINSNNESFYIDSKGKEMPVNFKHPTRTLIASGSIIDKYVSTANIDTVGEKIYDSILKTTPLYKIFKLAQFIDKDKFWKAQIDQIYLNNEYELELVPRVGNHLIVIGDTENLNEKFEKLYIFYLKGLNKIGWNKYKCINVKFKNQVVCS